MARAVPLIRAMALVPAFRWLNQQGHPAATYMRNAGLPADPLEDPMRPVPLIHVARLVEALACVGGPDVSCRIVASASTVELAMLGRVALGTRTPIEAIERISAALPFFCSHEHLSVSRGAETVTVRHFYSASFDALAEHLLFQYAAAMADRLCAMTGSASPRLKAVRLPPHPEHGTGMLDRWFGGRVSSLPEHVLEIVIGKEVGDRRFPVAARDRFHQLMASDLTVLRGDGSLSSSALIALASMLDDGIPAISDLASVSGMSTRTLQRRLGEEGTSFSKLLEQVRRMTAMKRLTEAQSKIGIVAADLGYARQASLTRAMRRWTGKPPIRFRRQQSSDR